MRAAIKNKINARNGVQQAPAHRRQTEFPARGAIGTPGGPGRPHGKPNKATRNAREAIAALVEDNAPRMQGWLDKIAKEQGALMAWRCLHDVIEYHIPKLSRQEVVGGDGGPLEVRVTWRAPATARVIDAQVIEALPASTPSTTISTVTEKNVAELEQHGQQSAPPGIES